MNIKRIVYAETDVGGYPETIEIFSSMEEARAFAEKRLTTAISNLLGPDYVIPKEDIDKDGYIDHMHDNILPEVTSCEWGWTVYDGKEETINASIYEKEIVLTAEEVNTVFRKEEHQNLLQDAKYNLYEFLKYMEDPEEGSYWAARACIVEEHMLKNYQFSVQEAVTPRSKYYILERMVSLFEKRQSTELDESSVWRNIVEDVLDECMDARELCPDPDRKELYSVSSDNGLSWEEKLLTVDEASTERLRGHIAVRI